MKKIKYIIPLVILFIAIGFAAISYTLNLDGNAGLAGDLDKFNVYYSNTYVNGVEDYSVITSPTELDFTTTLKEPGTTYSITYDVTNASKHFDAQLTMTCTSGDAYMSVENNFDTSTNLESLGTRSGTITIKKLKSIANETNTKKTISCTLTATPVERTTLGEGAAIDKQYAVLKATSETDTTMFRAPEYKEKIKTITFQDTINIPEEAIESWDIGVAQNGNVMAYLVTNPTDTTMYDLYIQANGKIYGNRDMSYWFDSLVNLEEIKNLNLLDTSSVVNMSYMFNHTGYNSTSLKFDVSSFNTKNVTNMDHMFSAAGIKDTNFILDVSNFDTSKVTDMGSMFSSTGKNSTIFTLDVSNFDTSNVTDMSGTFAFAGNNNKNFTLDVSNLNTSKVTNMTYMFLETGYRSDIFTLDVSNFDTSNVDWMKGMFQSAGYNSLNFTLDVSNFDTSKSRDMSYMFSYAGYNSTKFSLKLGEKFNTKKVTTMEGMFSYAGFNNPNFTLELGPEFDTSNVTSMKGMFGAAGFYSTILKLDLGEKFDTSNVLDMTNMFYDTGYQSTTLNTTITIRNPNTNLYENMFKNIATKEGSQITVNYTSETEALVDAMIATKTEGSNVVKGTLVQ